MSNAVVDELFPVPANSVLGGGFRGVLVSTVLIVLVPGRVD